MGYRECNPLNDYLFKFVFGRDERKQVTLNFLNAVLSLEGEDELTDIKFIDRDIDPLAEGDKLSKLDIFGIANDGSRIDIEVQVMNMFDMEKRTLYYWARMYQMLKKGQDYRELHRAITINLLDFKLLPQKEFHAVYGLYNMTNGHRLTDDIEIHFLEVPKFKAKSVKEMKRLEKWMAYFANKLSEGELEELAMGNAAINEALTAESVFMQKEIERRKYEQREKALMDYAHDMGAARDEGVAIGIEKGIVKGRQEGKLEGKLETARNMLMAGMDIAMISKMTDLPEDEIRKLLH